MAPQPHLEFQELFDALDAHGLPVDIDRQRRFLQALSHEAAWSWPLVERVAIAIFAHGPASADLVRIAIREISKQAYVETDPPSTGNGSLKTAKPQSTERGVLKWVVVSFVILILLTAGADVTSRARDWIWPPTSPPNEGSDNRNSNDSSGQTDTQDLQTGPTTTDCPPGSKARRCQPTTAIEVAHWWIGVLLLSTAALLGLAYCRRCPLVRQVGADPWKDGMERFFPGRIGPKRPPFIDTVTLDTIAGTLTVKDDDSRSNEVDLAATIDRTARNAGIPAVQTVERWISRRVVVIDDTGDPYHGILRIAQTLVQELSRRGVEVERLTAPRGLDALMDGSGRDILLKEVLVRSDQVVIVVGRGAIWADVGSPDLQRLQRFPAAIWIDMDLPKWTRPWRVTPRGMIRTPPVSDQILAAFEAIAGLRLIDGHARDEVGTERSGDPLRWLGDALPLAVVCAVAQPISYNLADHLRRRFFRRLSPIDLRRIAQCRGVDAGSASFEYAPALLRRLHREFGVRFTAEERARIVRDILSVVEDDQPSSPETLAHASWDAYYRRIQLLEDPDTAIPALQALSATSLGGGIRHSLKRLYDEEREEVVISAAVAAGGPGEQLRYLSQGATVGPLALSDSTWWLLIGGTLLLLSASAWLFLTIGMTAS